MWAQQVTKGVLAVNCAREGGSGWIWGKTTSNKEWGGNGTGCQERWGSHHPRRCWWMWHWQACLVSMVGLAWWVDSVILEVFSNFSGSLILWSCLLLVTFCSYSCFFFTAANLITATVLLFSFRKVRKELDYWIHHQMIMDLLSMEKISFLTSFLKSSKVQNYLHVSHTAYFCSFWDCKNI